MKSVINVGLIGAGRIGQVHAETLAYSVPGARLAGIADLNAAVVEETARRLGASRWTTDPLELINDPNIQAVAIASPNDTHADLIIAAASAGKAIFCEKPIDQDLAKTEQALSAVVTAGAFAAWLPEALRCRPPTYPARSPGGEAWALDLCAFAYTRPRTTSLHQLGFRRRHI